MRKAALRDVHT